MLGHRGCRLGMSYPEISEMQARAVFEAAAEVQAERHQGQARNHDPARRVSRANCNSRSSVVHKVAAEVAKEQKVKKLDYLVGTMIEIPRACVVGGRDRQERASSSPSAPTT